MKILHINSNYIYTWLHQTMLEQFDPSAVESRVYAPVVQGYSAVVKVNDNAVVDPCFHSYDKISFFYKQYKILHSFDKKMNAKDFDLLHAYTLFTDGNIAYELHKKTGVPYVVAIRNTDVNAFFAYRKYLIGRALQILRHASAIFFLSDAYCKQVFTQYIPKKYHDVLLKKVHIIPNGIDRFWFENPPTKAKDCKNSLKLVYAGRIDQNKNIPTTQKAMKILREKGMDVSLTVVGRVVDEKAHTAAKADPYTTFLPAKPKEELLEVYRQHNIFVMPSFCESFGLVYAEAMSQGLPVIYTKGQGFDGQFPEGMVGFSVDAHSAKSVAEGIEKAICDFDAISKNAPNAAKKFEWQKLTDQYTSIYKKILNKE